jgi:SAM-dependent methyltransferase
MAQYQLAFSELERHPDSDFRVLNAGSGSRAARQLHPAFREPGWQEVRIDVDAGVEPDVVGSVTDMTDAFADRTFDAIWSSHVLEHLFAHQVPLALAEFHRVLKPDGFALITSPDLETVGELIATHGLSRAVYVSSAGPITPLDMLFGHGASIARGKEAMAHKTGFVSASLGNLLVEVGFASALARREKYDLWALALMSEADEGKIRAMLKAAGLDMFDGVEPAA